MTPPLQAPHETRAAGYAPRLRTALVLTGSGTAGAYHAGVLRALDEAGVKIDLIGGCGMGVAGAMIAAIDGSGRLWDATGLWRNRRVRRLYRWRLALRLAAAALAWTLAAVAVPALVLVGSALVYPVAFFLGVMGLESGRALGAWHGRMLEMLFAPDALPSIVPRLVVLCLAILLAVLISAAVASRASVPKRRRSRGALWWRLFGSPLDASRAQAWFLNGLWQLIRGSASGQTSRRRGGTALRGASGGEPWTATRPRADHDRA